MRLLKSLSTVATVLASLAHGATADSQLTVYAWPISAASPLSLAEIKLSSTASTPSSSTSDNPISASIITYTPPSIALSKDQLIRIGIYDPSTKAWIGTGTSALSFAPGYDRKILLHMDDSGNVFHVGFTATPVKPAEVKDDTIAASKKKKKKTKKSTQSVEPVGGETTVEILFSSPAPQPALNKPVVLSPDGKADDNAVEEKSFLQKYWMYIAIFLVLNLAVSGGGDS